MKKLILTASLIACIGIAQAQTEKGGWLIGATSSLGFNSTKFDGVSDRQTSFNIGGLGGYFLMDNLAAGLNVGYSSAKQGNSKGSSTLIGPFARYYVNGTFFVGASFSAASSKFDAGLGETKTNFTVLAFEAGYPIWIVDNVAIEPSLNYGMSSGDDITNSNSFGLNVGFSLYF
ncbi:outer membrane beta-barrel protein [Ekhidna sp. To15]|uniref:outer membrane beta-barrel protein n=1 Tax=Ekhidna sp. To15 TaxID=3395267 RepID=UPI003F5279AD